MFRPRTKYGNKRTEVDGKSFASKKEAKVYQQLKLLEKAGQISDLQTQVTFRLDIDEHHICRYIADFVYIENGKRIVADAKGFKTPEYKLKKKLMLACHGIEILEF